jgi:hypothetical protein
MYDKLDKGEAMHTKHKKLKLDNGHVYEVSSG